MFGNTLVLALRSIRRNLLRSFQNGYFSAPIADWQESDFRNQIGAEVWTGTATVKMEVNTDITTRLPMADALAGQGGTIAFAPVPSSLGRRCQ